MWGDRPLGNGNWELAQTFETELELELFLHVSKLEKIASVTCEAAPSQL